VLACVAGVGAVVALTTKAPSGKSELTPEKPQKKFDAFFDIASDNQPLLYGNHQKILCEKDAPYLFPSQDNSTKKQLTLPNGTLIKVKEGDWLIPIVVYDWELPVGLGYSNITGTHFRLPYRLLHGLTGSEVKLQYGEQKFTLTIPSKGPQSKNTELEYNNWMNSLQRAENELYSKSRACAPIPQKEGPDQNEAKGEAEAVYYRPSSIVMQEEKQLEKVLKLLNSLKEKPVIAYSLHTQNGQRTYQKFTGKLPQLDTVDIDTIDLFVKEGTDFINHNVPYISNGHVLFPLKKFDTNSTLYFVRDKVILLQGGQPVANEKAIRLSIISLGDFRLKDIAKMTYVQGALSIPITKRAETEKEERLQDIQDAFNSLVGKTG